MIKFCGHGLLLDIEGTTSAVAYVYDVMFPYARRELGAYLVKHGKDDALVPVLDQIARDAGAAGYAEWTAGDERPLDRVRDEVVRLMDGDIKATGLKQLQGVIWEDGFKSGELKAHVYPDVAPAIDQWRDTGRDVRIYSSGSIHAQRLFFAHSEAGDLTPHFSGHYDTTTGPKREAASYAAILQDWGLAPGEVLFLSDVVAELDAAAEAGLATALVVRPGNAPVEPGHGHAEIASFSEITLA
ncbi:Enolase-phosphatase E1 [Pseudobythopirellula maris]|uniref:Enolase-phosphatase E1 n=1 Tax=Pseudobythopirellula maris TaxID=2527991 RepID=A0A5C5ZH62_9BACT|nr:acireductone synthase [Pseudobythopirellula maris]TWT86211.1 Enolase-phosphatase E1 [Pseudobythopirellula maris]